MAGTPLILRESCKNGASGPIEPRRGRRLCQATPGRSEREAADFCTETAKTLQNGGTFWPVRGCQLETDCASRCRKAAADLMVLRFALRHLSGAETVAR